MISFLDVVGAIACSVAIIYLLVKIYRTIFGYSEYNCPNDHDTMARQCSRQKSKCSKCGTEL